MLLLNIIMNNPTLRFDDGINITLEQMLIAKENRVNNQQQVFEQYPYPLISLSLVIPGPIKKSSGTVFLFNEAVQAIHQMLNQHNISIIHEKFYESITGDEALLSIDYNVDMLKQLCIKIEERHFLGRLWDIDVIDPITQKSISRSKFEHHSRQCLVCHDNAKICGRSKRHSINEILSAIANKVNDYRNNETNLNI